MKCSQLARTVWFAYRYSTHAAVFLFLEFAALCPWLVSTQLGLQTPFSVGVASCILFTPWPVSCLHSAESFATIFFWDDRVSNMDHPASWGQLNSCSIREVTKFGLKKLNLKLREGSLYCHLPTSWRQCGSSELWCHGYKERNTDTTWFPLAVRIIEARRFLRMCSICSLRPGFKKTLITFIFHIQWSL